MAGPNGPKTNLPWLSKSTPEMEKVVVGLVQELFERKTHAKTPDVDKRTKSKLMQDFKNAEQSRTSVRSFLASMADSLKLEDINRAILIAEMKRIEKALHKLADEGRNMNDLGRCRLLLDDVPQYDSMMRLLSKIKPDGSIPGVDCRSVKIIRNKQGNLFDDFLGNFRKSGYAGSVNFDVEVDIGKGRKGRFEVQVMPRDYEETYDHSHGIFDMITILQETSDNLQSEAHKKVLRALVGANAALWIEQSARTGFDRVLNKSTQTQQITAEDLRAANEILDRLRTEIELKNGKKEVTEWQRQAMNGITYAKTSLMNIYLGQQPNLATPDYVR